MRDAWRLAVGTLTAVPVMPPRTVDARTAGRAMLLAPVAVAPLGVLVALLGWGGVRAPTPSLVVALLCVGVLAVGTRALHWDGLADTADGLTASYDAERSLEVMKRGNVGPAGAVAIVLVVGLQVSALALVLPRSHGPLLAAVLVCGSRAALALTCRRGVPPARSDGLGLPHAGTVPAMAAAVTWALLAVVVSGVVAWGGYGWWRGALAVFLAAAVVLALVHRTVRRFGGVTGDVYGAAIELCLATLLVVLA